MISPVATRVVAGAPPAPSRIGTTLPRHPDPDPVAQQQRAPREATPTDPWFDREHVATDDPAFVLAAVESARQGVVDARNAVERTRQRRVARGGGQDQRAERGDHAQARAARRREGMATAATQPGAHQHFDRLATRIAARSVRTNANFIVNQISYHENTLAQYRAQIAGAGRRGSETRAARGLAGLSEEPRTAADAQALNGSVARCTALSALRGRVCCRPVSCRIAPIRRPTCTGLARCFWNPLSSARALSSRRVNAVSATAGKRRASTFSRLRTASMRS